MDSVLLLLGSSFHDRPEKYMSKGRKCGYLPVVTCNILTLERHARFKVPFFTWPNIARPAEVTVVPVAAFL